MKVLYKYASDNLTVMDVSTNQPVSENFKFHTHSTYELYLLVNGKGNYLVENNTYPLENGCVILLRPGERHTVCIDETHPYERIIFNFSTEVLKTVDPHLTLLSIFNHRKAGVDNCYTFAQTQVELIYLMKKSLVFYENDEQSKLQFSSILVWVLSLLNFTFQQAKQPILSSLAKDDIPDVLAYINKNICTEISLDIICQKYFMSRAYLNRCFKEFTDCTVWEYIITKRLLLAKQKIESGEAATKAAVECGFKDYSTFYRRFKCYFGKTPSEDLQNRKIKS